MHVLTVGSFIFDDSSLHQVDTKPTSTASIYRFSRNLADPFSCVSLWVWAHPDHSQPCTSLQASMSVHSNVERTSLMSALERLSLMSQMDRSSTVSKSEQEPPEQEDLQEGDNESVAVRELEQEDLSSPMFIHPNDVLKILEAFVTGLKKPKYAVVQG